MTNPTAAMIVIGDEILSGRTRDANMHHLAGVLTEHAIDLKEVRVISDDPAAITSAVSVMSDAYTYVFTSFLTPGFKFFQNSGTAFLSFRLRSFQSR